MTHFFGREFCKTIHLTILNRSRFEPRLRTKTSNQGLEPRLKEGITMSKQAEFAVILKMNPMFADLGADELQRISSLCHTQNLGVGEMLFQKGDPGDALFGVRRGQIRIETGASDGSRLTLNFMGSGDLFGEVAVLDGESRTPDATAGEATELFVLRRGEFLSPLEREPKVAGKKIP